MESQNVVILKDECSECGSLNLIYDYVTGETICQDCGLVIQDVMINQGPEWRAFTLEEKESKNRVGAPTSYSFHDKGLSTSIKDITRDAYGRKLPLSTRREMYRLRKWQRRSHSSMDRNLTIAMSELDRLCDNLSVPKSVKEKAAIIYREALDKGLVMGRSIAAIIAASLYMSCRLAGTPRNLREVSKTSLVSWKEVARCYRLLLRKLKIYVPITDPITYLSKISTKAGVSGETQGLAVKVIQKAKEKHVISGKDPICIVAAALYLACKKSGEKKTQKSIADAAGVTEVALRNRVKTLKKKLNLEFD